MKEESHEEESEDDYETRTAQASMCKGCVSEQVYMRTHVHNAHMYMCLQASKWIALYQVVWQAVFLFCLFVCLFVLYLQQEAL